MTPISRRSFLTGTLAAALAGPAWREALAAKVGKERGAAPPPAGGELLNGVPFLDEPDLVFDQVLGAGLSGRRYLDLATLKDGDTVTPAERFFIRTTTPARLDTRRYWTLSWGTAGHPPRDLPLKELLPLVKPQGVHLLESVENGKDSRWGLISTADWGGISFTDLFTQVGRPEGSAYLLATGNDSHITPHADPTGGASWIFKVDDLLAAGAFLATEMNGQPLADDHGYPLRLVVPGWYGCTWIKWLQSLLVVPETEEATSQMKEYAERTFQSGVPKRAQGYYPALVEPAAVPVRVERWKVGGKVLFRVSGLQWGGAKPARSLQIRFSPGEDFRPVSHFAPAQSAATWQLWHHDWQPKKAGVYTLDLQIDGSRLRTRRLSQGVYTRSVRIRAGK